MSGKFVLAFDTVFHGWSCVKDENGRPFIYNSIEEASEDIQDENDFIIPEEEFIEGRRAIFSLE